MKRIALSHLIVALMILVPGVSHSQDSLSLYNGWSVGFQAGVGGMVTTGSLADALKGCVLFTGGVNAGYQRLQLKADVAYGQPSFKNKNPYHVLDDLERDLQLNSTANTTLIATGIQLGYTVWRQGKFSITPNMGIGFNRLSWELNNIKWEKNEDGEERPSIDGVTGTHETSMSWIASVDFDIRLHGKITDSPFGNGQSHYASSVRISPFITHAGISDFVPKAKGACIGLSVCYSGVLRTIR